MASETTGYQVLARKYRPKTFDQLIGQDVMVKTLRNAIKSRRLAHAFVLTGVRGVGKTTTARLLASALNCLDAGKGEEAVEPCGKCDNCTAIAESRHPDVIEMDAASRTGVDDVREIIENVRYAPQSARFKVYIIDEVHMLSKNAFNALLKTLEEPPPHVKFIFATTEIRKMPVTVLSRCQRFDLRRVEGTLLADHLKDVIKDEKCKVAGEAVKLIARAAEGSVRDALSLLDQAIAHGGGEVSADAVRSMLGLAERMNTLALFRAVMGAEVKQALGILDEQYKLGADPSAVIRDLADVTHWVTRIKLSGEAGEDALVSPEERKEGKALAESLSVAELARAWQLLLKGCKETQEAPAPVAAAEMVIVRLAHASTLPDPARLVKSLTGEAAEKLSAAQAPAPSPDAPLFEGARAKSGEGSQAKPAGQRAKASSGANVVAMALKPESPDDLKAPMPQSFRELVALFETRHEGVIGKYLYDDVSLVNYRPGVVSLYPVKKNLPATLPSRMRELLKAWTGVEWQVSLANTAGDAPLKVQDEKETRERDEQARAHPLVKKALEVFPDAAIESVRPLDGGGETAE